MRLRKTLPSLNELSELEISRRLQQIQGDTFADLNCENAVLPDSFNHPLRKAAVLLPLTYRPSGWHLLLTRRNDNLPEHSGQVAFPGGRSDPEDTSPEQTALRETYEEVGISPQDVRILGKLPECLTVSSYLVTPVVGVFSWPYKLKLAREEVVRAFTIPLNWLAKPENYEYRKRESSISGQAVQVVYYRLFHGELLWGLSARLTLALISALAAPTAS